MKSKLSSLLMLAVLGFTVHALAASAPVKTLVVTGGHAFDEAPFFEMFSGNLELAVSRVAHESNTNSTVYESEAWLNSDVVVLYDMRQVITDAQKQRFMKLFDEGVGLVVLHHALASFQDWPEYEKAIGGRYAEPDPKHPGKVTESVGWQHDIQLPVSVVNTNHPVTAGLKDFQLFDEIYWGYRVSKDVTPLLTTTHPKSGKPLAWVHTFGKSRIVCIQSGHGKEAFQHSEYRKLLAQSIRWAARKSATKD